MKKIILLILLFGFNLNVTFWTGILNYTKLQRAKVMEDFKEEQYQNIYFWENVLLNEHFNFFDTKKQIQSLEEKKEELLKNRKNLENTQNIILNRIENIEKTLLDLENDIKKSENEIESLNNYIIKTHKSVKDLELEISELQREIFETREVLLDYITHIYKKSNLVFDWWDVDSLKSMFLYWWNLGDIFSDLEFYSLIEIAWQQLLEKYRKLLRQQFIKKMDLQKLKNELKDLRSKELKKKKSLEEKKQFRLKILDLTQNKNQDILNLIELNEAEEKYIKINLLRNEFKLKNQIKEFLQKYNCDYIGDLGNLNEKEIYFQELKKENNETKEELDKRNCIILNKIIKVESMLTPMWDKKNLFLWPINPDRWLSATYKDLEYYNEVWSTHEAIDIKADQWTDIKAPRDWYITFVKPPIDESYSYVVLKHADWFVTVYWHVSDVFFDKYEYIKAWEVFARSWWEIGTFWAWYISTWPHLHFEIYKDREHKDPLEYLDLTYLKEEYVPNEQKYIFKYMKDFKDRYWFEYENEELKSKIIFTLSWSTEIERQKDLLSKYATSDFNNWNVWVEEALSWEIDPSFLMCIWLAETWLWRNLKTKFNVWNVWNVDSWWTWELPNARSWIYWIVRTLNNKFLWQYNSMDKLSRYWNKSWVVYSSSLFNWQKNMSRCLSALKMEHIVDDFKFRLK